MGADDGLPKLPFASLVEWEEWLEEWLEENHATSAGVWIKIAKKHIAIDMRYFLQRFSRPRPTAAGRRPARARGMPPCRTT